MSTFEFFKLSHKELVEAGYKWLLKNGSCGVAFKELKTLSWEIPDVIGFGSGGFSAIVECKASRSDFLCDKNKPFRKNPQLGMGSHRYYCCPKGLIKVEELPEGWGLIYVDEKGKGRLIHKPLKVVTTESGFVHSRHYAHEKNIQAEHGVMYSALRRLFIKGLVKHVYDQDYTLPKHPDALIAFNDHTTDKQQ